MRSVREIRYRSRNRFRADRKDRPPTVEEDLSRAQNVQLEDVAERIRYQAMERGKTEAQRSASAAGRAHCTVLRPGQRLGYARRGHPGPLEADYSLAPKN